MPFVALLLSLLFAAADQLFKFLVVRDIKSVGSKTILDGFLSFDYTENAGAAFSIMQGGRWIFIGITAVICILLIISMFCYSGHEFFSWAASVLIVGGGIGNMIDRVLHGFVVDYIHISFFPAIFNFGDCCVTIGALFLILHVLFFTGNDKTERVMRTK